MKKSLEVAIIGAAGQQGQEYYKLLKNNSVSVVVDSDFTKLSSLYSQELPGIKLFSNVEDAVKNSDFDVAVVCLPHLSHLEATLSLLKYNKIIIKEKPLALCIDQVEKYRNISSSNILTIVQRQFNPVFINAKKDLSILGKLYTYTYEYNLSFAEMTTGWRSSFKCSGGGVLIDMGYHILDIVVSFFGKPNKTTMGLSYCYDEMQQERLEDSASLLLTHQNDQIKGTINLNRHHPQKKEEFEIVGQNGSMIITPKSYKIFDRKNQLVKEFTLADSSQAKLVMFQTYLQHCRSQDFVRANFEHHASVVEVIENNYSTARPGS